MKSIENKHNYFLVDAKNMFDLERLKSDLEKYEEITDAPWQYFLEILSGNSQKQIAEKFKIEEKTVKQSLTQRLKPHLLRLLDLPEDQRIQWAKISQKLLDAGYGLDQDNDQPKFYPTLLPEIFKQLLEHKIKKMTSDFLANIYTPLRLIERKEKSKHREVTPENGSALYRANKYEISREFENDQFLTEVLLEGNSPKSQGRKIAIIGEPGSGKSTRLQQIALWLVEQSPKNNIIWISLADLRDHSLEDYLLKVWLKYALNKRETSEADQDELVEIFNQGNVWLLLDGIDEMGLSENPLAWVNDQIRGWIDQGKIIVTCRINVWDGNRQALNQFDVYRNLDFSDDQRNKFIIKFLDNLELSDGLINELGQPGKERISDLVRNPLRLTLICRSWQKRQGALPETKAGLYQECVDAYYDWKEEPKITKAQRKELHKALGELAKQALDRDGFRFRLTESQVSEVLGESDEGLFKLALDLGWLNEIGEAEENHEKIYAFLHPSFQEYFAAATIDNWDFFLPHKHTDQPIRNKKYRIFDSQWREVILMWLGRRDIEDEHKNRFIYKIFSFDDGCNDFYKHQALSLATIGLSSYPNCPFTEVIIDRSIFYAFNDFFDHIGDLAYQSLLTSCHSKVSDRLVKFYFSVTDQGFDDDENLISLLGELGSIDSYSMDVFLRFTNEIKEQSIFLYAIYIISRFGKNDASAILFLTAILNSLDISEYTDEIDNIICALGDIALGSNSNDAISGLKRIINESRDEEMIECAAENLGKIIFDYDLLMEIQDLKQSSNKYFSIMLDGIIKARESEIKALRHKIEAIKEEIKRRNNNILGDYQPIDLDKFRNFVEKPLDSQSTFRAEKRLRGIDQADATKIYPILCDIIFSSEDSAKIKFAHWIIVREIIKRRVIEVSATQNIVSMLKSKINSQEYSDDHERYEKCHEIIWECSKILSYPDFYKTWHGEREDYQALDYNQSIQIVIETENLNSITDKVKLLKRFRIRLLDSIPIEINSKIQTLTNNQPQYNGITADDLVYQIEQIILAIKTELKVEKLDLFLDNSDPSQLLLDLREKFSDLVKIDWNR